MGERIGKMPAMGIDLGTTYSCVAIWQSGEVVIIPNEQGNRTTPSYVAFTESECLVGDAAKSQAAMNSSNTVFDVKRLIGRKFKDESIQNDIQLWPFEVIPGRPDEDHPKKPVIVVNHKGEEKEFLPEQISAMVLTRMKQIADSYVGAPVKNVVITVPAYFNNEQRQATRDAGAIAGMNVLRLVNEPTAAAIAFGFHKTRGVEKNVLIFDLGGGTLDVSLITIENDVFEVKSVSGNTRLGGQDFDNKLVHLFVGEFKQKCRVDIRKDSRAIERLRTACEKAKRALSSTTSAKIDIDCLFKGKDFSSNISRVRFETLNKGLFQQCLAPVRKCLKDARMDVTDVDEVVLVGGSTRIPKIQELLQNMFPGKRLCKNIHPDEAVAHGAAVYAALLSCVEDKNFLLIDVTPLSLGVENNTGRMSVLIPKNTTIPTTMTKVFTTTEDNQTEVTFNVYEGERASAKKNNLLGTFELSGIPPAPKGEPVINVWFDIDADGIMECQAEEQANYSRNGIRITCRNNGRLSEEEIATLMAEAEKLKAEEEKHKLKIKAAHNVEEYAEEMRDMLKCRSMTKTDSKKMSDAIDHTLKWLDWNFLLTEVCKYQEKLEELRAICEPITSNLHIPCYCVDEDADFMNLSD